MAEWVVYILMEGVTKTASARHTLPTWCRQSLPREFRSVHLCAQRHSNLLVTVINTISECLTDDTNLLHVASVLFGLFDDLVRMQYSISCDDVAMLTLATMCFMQKATSDTHYSVAWFAKTAGVNTKRLVQCEEFVFRVLLLSNSANAIVDCEKYYRVWYDALDACARNTATQ